MMQRVSGGATVDKQHTHTHTRTLHGMARLLTDWPSAICRRQDLFQCCLHVCTSSQNTAAQG